MDSISTQFEKMELSSLKVINNNYNSLSADISKQKRKTLSIRYRYLAQKVFEGDTNLEKWLLGLRFVCLALRYDALLIFQSWIVLKRLVIRKNLKRENVLIKNNDDPNPAEVCS